MGMFHEYVLSEDPECGPPVPQRVRMLRKCLSLPLILVDLRGVTLALRVRLDHGVP